MRGAVLYGPRDLRFEERETPKIIKPTDVIIRITATCVCGSDLWPYRGIQSVVQPTPMGHEYCGIIEDIGSAVATIEPGMFVIGSFFASDNTCPNCRVGYQSSCQHAEFVSTAQAPLLRVPLADGTLVHSPWRLRGLRRRPARGRAERLAGVLRPRPSPWWSCSRATLLARPDQVGVGQEDRPRQGVRHDPASRPGGGSLPCDG